jgi:hypothetical protein
VERSGGFVGRTVSAEVDLDGPEGADLRGLVAEAVGAGAAKDELPKPDMYLYTFAVDGREPVRVPEHLLSGSQRELVRRVLDDGIPGV